MKLNNITRSEIIEALKEYSQGESELFFNQAEKSDTTFSEEHEKKIKDILHKHQHKNIFKKFFSTPSRKVASLIIAFILVSFVTVMSVEAFRVPILKYVSEKLGNNDTNIQVSMDSEEKTPPEVIREYRKPSYIPGGYKVISEVKDNNVCTIIYTNDETEQEITFIQSTISSGGYAFDTDEGTLSDIMVGLYNGKSLSIPQYYTENIYWSDGEYEYQITGFYISADELIEIGESVK